MHMVALCNRVLQIVEKSCLCNCVYCISIFVFKIVAKLISVFDAEALSEVFKLLKLEKIC